MKFYQGSELYLEWHHQHGCGVAHPNLRCQCRGSSSLFGILWWAFGLAKGPVEASKGYERRIVLQYMTDGDNPNIRDGTDQDSAGGDDDDPTEQEQDKSPQSLRATCFVYIEASGLSYMDIE